MSKRLITNVLLQVSSVLCFIAGVTTQSSISKVLLLMPVLLAPVVIVSYYSLDDTIKNKNIIWKVLFVILLGVYLYTVLTLSKMIWMLIVVSLVIAILMRNKRINSQKVRALFG